MHARSFLQMSVRQLAIEEAARKLDSEASLLRQRLVQVRVCVSWQR